MMLSTHTAKSSTEHFSSDNRPANSSKTAREISLMKALKCKASAPLASGVYEAIVNVVV